jgi:hypothetical protein
MNDRKRILPLFFLIILEIHPRTGVFREGQCG